MNCEFLFAGRNDSLLIAAVVTLYFALVAISDLRAELKRVIETNHILSQRAGKTK